MLTQPSSPAQVCTRGGRHGNGDGERDERERGVHNYDDELPRLGGSVSGLSGTGLVLQDNGGDNLSVSANGAFHVCDESGGRLSVCGDG